MANVVPVLVLAVVVEARAIYRQLNADFPRYARVLIALYWVTILLALAFAQVTALEGVRGDEVPLWRERAAHTTVTSATFLLISTPVLGLVFKGGGADVIVGLQTWRPPRIQDWPARVGGLYSFRRLAASARRLNDAYEKSEMAWTQRLKQARDFRIKESASDSPRVDVIGKIDEYIDTLAEGITDMQEKRSEVNDRVGTARAMLRRSIVERRNSTAALKAARRDLRRAKVEQALAREDLMRN